MNILESHNLVKSFGALRAVDGVNLGIAEGELHSIIGPNGAGKTTLFNLLTGGLRPSSGTIAFKGQDITGMSIHERSHLGMARSFQRTNIFPGLSTFENIRIAVQSRTSRNYSFFRPALTMEDVNEPAWQVLADLEMEDRADVLAGNLSHGDQRHLEVGVALATAPELLLLDEPTAGMSPEETASTVGLIKRISSGLTILLIEHDMDVVFSISDRITVMHYGRIIAAGEPEEVRRNREVQAAYLGGD
jgi:branched-chain amino acid transport system ATP-binding protein